MTEKEVEEAIRDLVMNYQIRAEGAAAATYAASLKIASDFTRPIVAILSGGNISDMVFSAIVENKQDVRYCV